MLMRKPKSGAAGVVISGLDSALRGQYNSRLRVCSVQVLARSGASERHTAGTLSLVAAARCPAKCPPTPEAERAACHETGAKRSPTLGILRISARLPFCHYFIRFPDENRCMLAKIVKVLTVKSTTPARTLTLVTVIFSLIGAISLHAQTYKVLHSFGAAGDASNPGSPMVLDQRGNVYGTALTGGPGGDGIVFELSPNGDGTWSESILHSFDTVGDNPEEALALDAEGNLYGATPGAGGGGSYGTIYELSPGGGTWILNTIHSFTGGTDGANPGPVIVGNGAQIYGAASNGETRHDGFVFSFSRLSVTGWTELFLHTFTGGEDGTNPGAPLTLDAAGNLYGITGTGGAGYGTVYELTPNHNSFGWTKSTLFSFGGLSGTAEPHLILDASGNIYGATFEGGIYFDGTVYKLSQNQGGTWSQTVLYNFQGTNQGDGELVGSALAMDAAGNIYGTTAQGGSGCNGYGCGIIFKLTPSSGGQWTETIVYQFTGGNDGWQPSGGLIQDRAGNLYGTTNYGGAYGNGGTGGVAFEFTP